MNAHRMLAAILILCGPLLAQPRVSPSDLGMAPGETALFKLHSILGVQNRPSERTVFTLTGPAHINRIWTYHWNGGRGKPGGTLALKATSGATYGPWEVGTLPGSGGVANAYWVAKPDVTLPAGTYEVLDSDPDSWATNSEMRNMGCTWIIGVPGAEKHAVAATSRTVFLDAVQSFRVQAIPEPIATLRKYSTPAALQDWTRIEGELFTQTPATVGWKYYFASATYSVLALTGQNATVLFYHPWSDTVLLTQWQAGPRDCTITRAELILGDALRQQGQPPFELQPYWERMGSPLTPLLSIQLAVGETLVAMERLFPANGNPEAQARRSFETALLNGDLRRGMVAAANLRFERSVTGLLRYEQDRAFEPYRESTVLILAGLKAGDLSTLQATVPQTSAETLGFLKAHAPEAGRFKVVAVLKSPQDCFIFLSSPLNPNDVLALWFQTDEGQYGLRQAQWINHIFSTTYLEQIRDLVAKGKGK